MSISIEIAKKYFALANDGDLGAIETMFRDSATYSSENTGIFLGVNPIMKMMKAFFRTFKQLHWDVKSVKEISDGVVLFDFVLSGEKLDGEKIEIEGLEYVVIYENKIQHIEVRNK